VALQLSFHVSERSFEVMAMMHRKMMPDTQRRPPLKARKAGEEEAPVAPLAAVGEGVSLRRIETDTS
jgi:hypothetical protein